MKLQVSNTNEPVWRSLTVSAQLPKDLKALEELSKNLWWVWNSEGKNLFRDLDHDLWRKVGENPVMLLQQISSKRLEEILADEHMMERINSTYAAFKEYMSKPMRDDIPSVVIFLNGVWSLQLLENLFRRSWSTCRRLYQAGIRQPCANDRSRFPISLWLFCTVSVNGWPADCQL